MIHHDPNVHGMGAGFTHIEVHLLPAIRSACQGPLGDIITGCICCLGHLHRALAICSLQLAGCPAVLEMELVASLVAEHTLASPRLSMSGPPAFRVINRTYMVRTKVPPWSHLPGGLSCLYHHGSLNLSCKVTHPDAGRRLRLL